MKTSGSFFLEVGLALLPFLCIMSTTGSLKSFADLNPQEFDVCMQCWCEKRSNCSVHDCNGDRNTTSYFCGPLQISQAFWVDAGRPLLESWVKNNITGWNNLEAFENCTMDTECSKKASFQYSNRYKRDCNNDGKFDCMDALLLHNVGPENCHKPKLPPWALSVPSIYKCYIERSNSDTLIMTVLLVVGMIVAVTLVLLIWVRYRRRRSSLEARHDHDESNPVRKVLRSMRSLEPSINLPPTAIIPPNDLLIDTSKSLGEGQFGMVYQGTLRDVPVAVKAPKLSLTMSAVVDLQKELEMMVKVGDHPHIVKFFGSEISQIRRGIVYVVLELSPLGALSSYLKRVVESQPIVATDGSQSYEETKQEKVTLKTQISWSQQIASGMAHLEAKNILHGDLATRNVLLFEGNNAKISDFGFARNLGHYEEYEKSEGLLPWRWMAVESLERSLFSVKSDVWALGITVWEIFTFAAVPYSDEQVWNSDFLESLIHGRRLDRPDLLPESLYTVLLNCWELFPEDRPTFTQLEREFQSALLELNDYSCKDEGNDSCVLCQDNGEVQPPRYVTIM